MSLIPPHGGYRNLASYQKAEIVFDATVCFCGRFVHKRDRTHDQMIQAARSGKQNIIEGSRVSGTSKELELKLTGVARASLDELLMDYQDYLRSHQLERWPKNSRPVLAIRRLARSPNEAYATYRPYLESRSAGTCANILICLTHQANYLLDRQLKRLEKDFLTNGGFRERMAKARHQHRRMGHKTHRTDT